MTLDVERVSDDAWAPIWIRHQHVARFEWAAGFAAGCQVIDAACGAGYGSHLLLETGSARGGCVRSLTRDDPAGSRRLALRGRRRAPPARRLKL